MSNLLSFLGGALTFISVVIGAWLNLRKTKEVHSLVNQQHEDLVVRNDQLITALEESGTKIPPKQEGTGATR